MTTETVLRVLATVYIISVFTWAWQSPVAWSIIQAVGGRHAAKGAALRSLAESSAQRNCSCQGLLTFHQSLSRISNADHYDRRSSGPADAAPRPAGTLSNQQLEHSHLQSMGSNITRRAMRRRWKHVLLRARATSSENRAAAAAAAGLQSRPWFDKLSPLATQSPHLQRCQGAKQLPAGERGLIGVYTGWLAQDNLGDEIVADIFLDLLTAAVMEATADETCVTLERMSPALASSGWRGCTLTSHSACDFGVMGGGSTISVDYIRRIEGILAAEKQVLLFGSGHQSGLHQTAADMRKYLTLFCRRKLLGGVRGPFTQAHLQKYGCSRSSIPIIRDSGFISRLLYQGQGTGARGPESGNSSSSRLQQQLQEHTGRQRPIIAVTLKEEFMPILDDTVQALLAGGRYAVVLQAVDNHTVLLHQRYQRRVNQDLPPGAAPVMIHQEYQDWAAVLDLYRRSSASLNSRLHSGVLSASALRPTLFVANNTKFADFCTSLGSPESRRGGRGREALEPAVGYSRHNLVDNIERAISRSSITQHILERLQQDTYYKYKAAMVSFLSELEKQDPARYRATLCCKHIHITRSAPQDKRVLVRVQCMQPAGAGTQLSIAGPHRLSTPT